MMKRLLRVGGLLLLSGTAMGFAQVSAKPADKPALTDLETAYVQIVALSGQLAQCESDRLQSVKQFVDVRTDVLGRIEKAHPGYTVDLASGALIEKKATTK